MAETRFWLIRHALVAENARAMLYGTMDVPLCPEALVANVPMYRSLAARLPRPAAWVVTPLSRTALTAEALFRAGYPAQLPAVEPDLIEQDLGDWHGLPHADLPPKLQLPAHAFWPLGGEEVPPGGESMADVIAGLGERWSGWPRNTPGRMWSWSAMAAPSVPPLPTRSASGQIRRCICPCRTCL